MLLGDRRVRGLLLAGWLPISLSVGAEGALVPYAAGLGRPGTAGLMLGAGVMTGQAAGIAAGGALAGFAGAGPAVALCGGAAVASCLALGRHLRT
ncbi:hypothetical protein [Actinomadura fibrosa]|uniref:MFS transporter n=1 Tax=Actinomadura fibrosa TaxID=111802 RepID=A0ABW2Y1A0_9ACTN|nr:hypothetical protein [Actinomadura fibrosa]